MRTNSFPTPEIAVAASPPPLTGYRFSKLVAEYIARTYFEEYGVKFLIVRPFGTYGPGEVPGDYVRYAHVIPDLIKKTLSGQYALEILGVDLNSAEYPNAFSRRRSHGRYCETTPKFQEAHPNILR